MIAIKGLKMPKNCLDCPFDGVNCSVVPNFDNNSRPNDCPLREVVTLKDRKIADGFDEHYYFNDDSKEMDQYIRREIELDMLNEMHDSELVKITKEHADPDLYPYGSLEYSGEVYVVKV